MASNQDETMQMNIPNGQNSNNSESEQALGTRPQGSDETVTDSSGVPNLRHRTAASAANPPQQGPVPPEPQVPDRRGRGLLRDTERLLSLINTNPVTSVCIFITCLVIVIGFGYFLFELHLAYKYSTIINNLHVSSLKNGYGQPSSFSSSSQHQSRSKLTPGKNVPPDSSFSNPSNLEANKPLKPMLDAETEMYANQLKSVLTSLKRTVERIDPTTNSTTLIAGLVELKPVDTPKPKVEEVSKTEPISFTTEIKSKDPKNKDYQKSGSDTDPVFGFTEADEDILKVLKRTLGIDLLETVEESKDRTPQKLKLEEVSQRDEIKSFPEFLKDLKKSVSEETSNPQEKLSDWIVKNRHKYTDEAEWRQALKTKMEDDEDRNKFANALLYVANELETEYINENGVGNGDDDAENNNDDTFALDKLLKILNRNSENNIEEENDDGYSSDTSSASDKITVKKSDYTSTPSKKERQPSETDDWDYSNWDEDEDAWDEKIENEDITAPQFA